MTHQNNERYDKPYIGNDWLRYDEDDRKYFVQKAKAQKKWADRSRRN